MAICALPGRIGVSTGQNESGRAVVEARNIHVQPIVGGVATLARGRELCVHVARIIRRREVRLVAGKARRRHRLEFAVRPALVASVTVDSGMGSRQREPIVMRFDIFNGDLPSPNRMALFAVCSQLALVNIGVAVLAPLAHA